MEGCLFLSREGDVRCAKYDVRYLSYLNISCKSPLAVSSGAGAFS